MSRFRLIIPGILVFSLLASDAISSPADTTSLDNWLDLSEWRWMPMETPTDDDIISVAAVAHDHFWILTFKGKLYEFERGKWSAVDVPDSLNLERMYTRDGKALWFTGRKLHFPRDVMIRFEHDRWRVFYLPNVNDLRDLDFDSAGNVWVVGERGDIFKFNGRRWRKAPAPINLHFYDVLMTERGEGWITGDSRTLGCLLHYRAGGWHLAWLSRTEQLSHISTAHNALFARVINASPPADERYALWQDSALVQLAPEDMPAPPKGILFWEAHLTNEGLVAWAGSEVDRYLLRHGAWRQVPDDLGIRVQISHADTRVISPGAYGLVAGRGGGLLRWEQLRESAARTPPAVSVSPLWIGDEDIIARAYGVAILPWFSRRGHGVYVVETGKLNRFMTVLPVRKGAGQHFDQVGIAKLLGIQGELRTPTDEENYDVGAAFFDAENDGDWDLLLASQYDQNRFFVNRGNNYFDQWTDDGPVAGDFVDQTSAAITGDVNNDGFVDVFVSNEMAPCRLALNDGMGRFDDVTEAADIPQNFGAQSPAFADYDNDGDLDLFIPHWNRPNRLLRNDGPSFPGQPPRFADVTRVTGLMDIDTTMNWNGAAWGDYDNDGYLDLYVTNHATTNKLYRNLAGEGFQDVTEEVGLADSAGSYGCTFLDFDNDGDLDLFVCNVGLNYLYLNEGGSFRTRHGVTSRFTTSARSDLFVRHSSSHTEKSTGCAYYDEGLDGDLDIYVANYDAPCFWIQNLTDNANYIRFYLRGTKSNRSAIGARAYLYEAGHAGEPEHFLALREISGGSGYMSMNSPIIHFGADSSQTYDVVFWFPSGTEKVLTGLKPPHRQKVWEHDGPVREMYRARNWAVRTVRFHTNQFLFLEFLLVLGLASFHTWLVRFRFVNRRQYRWMGLLFTFVFFWGIETIRWTLGNYRTTFWYAAPAAAVVAGYVVFYLLYFYQESDRFRSGISRELVDRIRVFDHNQDGAQSLSGLLLVTRSLSEASLADENAWQRVVDTFSHYHHRVAPALLQMVELAYPAGLVGALYSGLHRDVKTINKRVRQGLRNLEVGKDWEFLRTVQPLPAIIDRTRSNIREIKEGMGRRLGCDPAEVVRDVAKHWQQRSDVRVGLVLDVAPGTQARITQPELGEVLDNLFSNALSALLDAEEQRIDLSLRNDLDQVVIDFKDSGQGVSSEAAEQIFDYDYTGHEEPRGQGLYQVRSILSVHGGTIRLVNPGDTSGARFEIRLQRVSNG